MNDARKFQIILPALAAVFVCAGVVFGVMLMQSWREYQAFGDRQAAAQERLQTLHAQNATQEQYLTELLRNPELVERAARERLKYSREGELIFKFEK